MSKVPQKRLQRVLEILLDLLKGENISTRSLSQKYGLSIRTIQRDIRLLRAAGINLKSNKGIIKFGGKMKNLDLSLSSQEKKLALLSLELSEKYLSPAFFDTIMKLKEKLTKSLKEESIYTEYVDEISAYTILSPKFEKLNHKIFEKIESAILKGKCIKILYSNPQKGEDELLFEPYQIIYSDEHWFIFGKVRNKNFETFLRISRIKAIEITQKSFSRPNSKSLNEKLKYVWGTHYSNYEPIEIKIKFSENVAQKIKDTLRHPTQSIEDLKDGGIIYTIKVLGYREIISWVLSWGRNAEILSPDWVRERIKNEIKEMARVYDDNK
ncbi:MAG: hypothetical protein PWQ20_1501 [Thermotogaceae bacterium]|jgi:predicted DNA-binding transcriptional regulator YafY|nr:hypothetical protein [Thermotogaceae bacterium]